ncbi:MAG: hypothetical protein LCH73_08615 [Proteobacteria bacterium]|nr:hypothetical protein [Pseudomonadota bacterium]
MINIILVALSALLLGLLLGSPWLQALPIPAGVIGVAAMLASAWFTRRHWQHRPDDAPGAPERAQWHGLASYALLAGHLMALIVRLGPAMDMHGPLAHRLAIDNWMLVAGALLSWRIARDPDPRRDERDTLIAATALRQSHAVLLLLLLVLILALGFGGTTVIGRLNQPLLAHLLILAVVLQALVYEAAQLRLHALDARAARGLAP